MKKLPQNLRQFSLGFTKTLENLLEKYNVRGFYNLDWYIPFNTTRDLSTIMLNMTLVTVCFTFIYLSSLIKEGFEFKISFNFSIQYASKNILLLIKYFFPQIN